MLKRDAQEETLCKIMTTKESITLVCRELEAMLHAKNDSYGDSALDPVRIFSKATPEAAIAVRIDDKLSRIARGTEFPGDNDVLDLSGYLILELARRKKINHPNEAAWSPT